MLYWWRCLTPGYVAGDIVPPILTTGGQGQRVLREGIEINIYVGNLSRDVTEEELRQLFTPFGQVASVSIIKDKYSGQSRGFAFVEMPTKSEGEAAILGIKGKTLRERTIDISESRPRSESRGGKSYGGGKGGGYGGERRQRY